MLRTFLRLIAAICLAGVIGLWVTLGAEKGWTKTSVPIQKTDEITGIEYPVFENRFVPGLDFLVAGCAGSIFLAAVSFIPTTKKKKP
jgi:uncharacterized membrane protein YraQ (UPF0718 family)